MPYIEQGKWQPVPFSAEIVSYSRHHSYVHDLPQFRFKHGIASILSKQRWEAQQRLRNDNIWFASKSKQHYSEYLRGVYMSILGRLGVVTRGKRCPDSYVASLPRGATATLGGKWALCTAYNIVLTEKYVSIHRL